ncbi:FHA domain-containing protein [Conyzicola sp.]|uniref:FHA domain-containing protein n=1 Tax=Conyzicola sp. TaxID=1969404 RepID=UPI00398A127B
MTTVSTRQAVAATSGGWIAFSSASRILVVGASPNDAFVAALWSVVGLPDGLQRTLDLVTSKGLSATPPFALLDFTAGLRAIVRGDVTVTVTRAGGEETLSGSGVSTWIERSIDRATSVSLVVGGATAAAVPALPLETGAAWIASLSVGEVPVAEPVEAQPVAEHVEATAAPVVITPPAPVEIDVEATVSEPPAEPPAEASDDTPTVAIDNLESSPEGYDYLFGDTMYRSVADAAVRDEEEAEADAPSAESAGDHDGHTVLTSDIAKLRGRRKSKTDADTPPIQPEAPVVSLVLADGTREPLSQPILVGRSPSVSQVSGGKMPKLITVGGADQDISRTHVRFVLEGGTVVVTDLHSRNGTTIAMPGKEPQKLRAGEPTSVIVGTVVDLGGGVTFTVDEAGL